jgi:predicted aldo/keto reductase-like oxidoreductase
VLIATKSPIWRVERHRDFDRFLDEQLARLQTDHIDFYLLHCVQKHSWEKLLRLEVFNWAEKAQAAGRIGQLGFSFHDTFEVFREVVDAYPWTFCQLQYNYVCEEVQAGARGVEYAAAKGLAVVVMEPLFGGSLARPPQPIRQLWKNLKHPPDPVDLALRWLWDKPEVSVVLSGMSTMRQLKHNLRIADRAGVGLFSVRDRRWIERMQEKYRQLAPVPCTKCGYCLPCPQGVSIPINLELYNHAQVYKGNSRALSRNLYHAMPERQRAAACRGCGACEARCPQKIGISSLMSRAARLFA